MPSPPATPAPWRRPRPIPPARASPTNIGDAKLTNILLTYNDAVDGMNVRAKVGELAVNMDEVDVDAAIYKVDQAALRNTSIRITQTKVPPPSPADTAGPGPGPSASTASGSTTWA